MKKIMYAILICIIIAGIVIIATIGLKADIIYSKNVEIDAYVGKIFEKKDIEDIVNDVFPNERVIIQEIEMFGDMFSITLADNRTEEELNAKVDELKSKLNEKYEVELSEEDINIVHNAKIRLSSIILPYVYILAVAIILVFVFVGFRYKKLGLIKILGTYLISIIASELLLLSIIAITRYPINRIVIPVGLLVLVVVITVLGFINEKKLD